MSTKEMTIVVNGHLDLDRLRSGLPAAGWEITSHLPDKVSASRGPYKISGDEASLTFGGFLPSELFGDSADSEKAALVSTVLGLLPVGR
ncbi:MAG: hypothetical protein QM757_25830 [Paludibaculum sp.]